MTGSTIALRCTRCGTFLSVGSPMSVSPVWYACPQCAAPLPVITPRDPPPLFSWEVYPDLYPPLPAPRGPSARLPLVSMVILAATTILLLGVAGLLIYGGATSLHPGRYAIAGTVTDPNGTPIAGAVVKLTGSDGFATTVLADGTGAFSFPNVPGGNITVNASAPGYSPQALELFLSPTYTAAEGGATSLRMTLYPGPPGAPATEIETAFPDLESLIATLWSGAIVLGAAAMVCATGAYLGRRDASRPVAVAGGVSAVLAPFSFVVLGLTTVFPNLTYVGAVLVALGVTVVTLTVIPMALAGVAPDP
ncbi:MAG: carboxypeptidase-like regulatory domain-containing protein [Thermoplasmata archaeon]|nr:carboxypeptidase-like regulatory domain-containing protein [Thermoplasmata archaeon]